MKYHYQLSRFQTCYIFYPYCDRNRTTWQCLDKIGRNFLILLFCVMYLYSSIDLPNSIRSKKYDQFIYVGICVI